jgi:hypothetical protein
MTRTEAIQEQIDDTMDQFDFRKVAEYMKSVNWTWNNVGIPGESDLRKYVRDEMRKVSAKGEHSHFSGGFMITFDENTEEKWLRFAVSFVIETWIMDGVGYGVNGLGEPAAACSVVVDLTDAENTALDDLCTQKDMTRQGVMLAALRLYQAVALGAAEVTHKQIGPCGCMGD